MSNLYERIDNLCEKEGITVTEMCRRAQVPRGNLTDLNKGRQKSLATKNMIKIANYFNVSVEYLETGEKEKAPVLSDEGIELTNVQRRAIELIKSIEDDAVLEIFIAAMEKAKQK